MLLFISDKWVMMINQTHPKILSRLQIGLDAAKNAMARGQSCEIRVQLPFFRPETTTVMTKHTHTHTYVSMHMHNHSHAH